MTAVAAPAVAAAPSAAHAAPASPPSTPRLWPGEPTIVPGSARTTAFERNLLSAQYGTELARMELDGEIGWPSIGGAIGPVVEMRNHVGAALGVAPRDGIPADARKAAALAQRKLDATISYMQANAGDGELPEAPKHFDAVSTGLQEADRLIWEARRAGTVGGTPFPPVPDIARPFFGSVEWRDRVDGHGQRVRVSFLNADKGVHGADASSAGGFGRYWNTVEVERATDRGLFRKPVVERARVDSQPGDDVVRAVDELRRQMLEGGFRDVDHTGPVMTDHDRSRQPVMEASASFVRMQGEHVVTAPIASAPAPMQSLLDAARGVVGAVLR